MKRMSLKSIKRFLSTILTLALLVSLLAFPAFAQGSKRTQEDYPFVFVHGLMGWGERSELNSVLPYWGMTTGDLLSYLNGKGYESYAATVGPLSSAWDRACELYAQLTGTTVDYGAAHSAEKDHDRYGITYEEPLFEGWSADKKINLIGHSFGGATVRLFLEILTNGCPEEVAAAEAAGTEVSPFFKGGRGDWVYSLTTVSAPHNGTTFIETCDMAVDIFTDLIYNVGSVLKATEWEGVYDLQLEHFGIVRKDGETDLAYLKRVLGDEEFLSHEDNAIYDLSIDHALAINDGIEMQDGVYYFSVTGDDTHYSTVTRSELPNSNMLFMFRKYARRMGAYCNKTTAGGVYIDESWLPNDGMVNVVSGLYPLNSNLQCLREDGTEGFTYYNGYSRKNFEAGIWNVLPTQPYDHLGIVGGLFTNTTCRVRSLYLDLIDNVTSTYSGNRSCGSGILDWIAKKFF